MARSPRTPPPPPPPSSRELPPSSRRKARDLVGLEVVGIGLESLPPFSPHRATSTRPGGRGGEPPEAELPAGPPEAELPAGPPEAELPAGPAHLQAAAQPVSALAPPSPYVAHPVEQAVDEDVEPSLQAPSEEQVVGPQTDEAELPQIEDVFRYQGKHSADSPAPAAPGDAEQREWAAIAGELERMLATHRAALPPPEPVARVAAEQPVILPHPSPPPIPVPTVQTMGQAIPLEQVAVQVQALPPVAGRAFTPMQPEAGWGTGPGGPGGDPRYARHPLPPPPPIARRGMDLDIVWQAVVQYRSTLLGFAISAFMATLVASLTAQEQYRATAVIQLMPKAGQEMQANEVMNNDAAGYMEGRDRARTQIQIILSRSIRLEVVKRYTELGNTDVPNTADGIDALGKALSAEPREDTQLVEISVMNPDPHHAALLANLFAEVYKESNLSSRTDAARVTSAWVDSQRSSSKAALDSAEMAAMGFKRTNDLGDIDQAADGVTSRLGALQSALGEATSQRVLLESKLSEHRHLLAKGDYDQLSAMFADPALQTLAQQRASVISSSADVLAQYGEQHPEHQRAVSRIKGIEDLIAKEVRRNVDGEASQVDTLFRQERAIGNELDSVKSELLERQRLQTQYRELKLEEDNARRVYDALGARGADVGLQASSQLNDVRIIDPALAPTRPATPNIPLNLAMALAVGLGGGFALAMLRFRLNETIMTTSDLERYLETPLLGSILSLPAGLKVADRALHSFNHPRSQSAESLRAIRGVLQTFPANGKTRRILVTSCIEGEGKTHSALGIAVSFAQLGQAVLLIDGDLRLPQMHKLLGVPESPGLSDALVAVDAQAFVLRTLVPRLFLLPRGAAVDYPNELLASAEMERLLTRMGDTFDVIVIDTPPAAVVSDALSLARQVDGVVLVIRRGRVSRNLAIKTLGQLRQMGARVFGVALNDMPRTRQSSSYYYDEAARQPTAASKDK